ncbi:MAG: YceI family protein [Anaeromyxobacteraceae bacterium]
MTGLLPALLLLAAQANPVTLHAGPGDGRLVIHAFKKGLFSAFAHDHAFEAGAFSVRAVLPDGDPVRAEVEVVVDARTLEDHAEGLSAANRRKVSAQARGPEHLDAERFPEVRWTCEGLALDPPGPEGVRAGRARGVLDLHGVRRPVVLEVELEPEGGRWRVRAHGKFRQSEFGVHPFSGMGGALAVKDEVELEVSLTLGAAAAAP